MDETEKTPEAGTRNQARKPTKAKKKRERSPQDEQTQLAVRLWEMREQILAGEPFDRVELESLLDSLPDEVRKYGDIQRHRETQLIARIVGKDAVMALCIKRENEDLRAKLAGMSPSPIEELVVDEVMGNRLLVKYYDSLSMKPSQSIKEDAFLMQLSVSAQRRYRWSIELLAKLQNANHKSKPKSGQELACSPKVDPVAMRAPKAA